MTNATAEAGVDFDDVDLSAPDEVDASADETETKGEETDAKATKKDPSEVATEIFESIATGLIGDARNGEYTDETNGSLTEAGSRFVTAALAPAGTRVRKYIEELITARLVELMGRMDFTSSRSLVDVQSLNHTVAPPKRETKPAVELSVVERLAALLAAAELFKTTEEQDKEAQALVESLGDDLVASYRDFESGLETWREQVKALTEGQEPPAKPAYSPQSPVARLAADLYEAAVGVRKSRAGRPASKAASSASSDGTRRSIVNHIREALASSGDPLSPTEIHNFKSKEYGEASPSSGAIGAWLAKESDILAERLGARVVESGGRKCLQRI